MMTNTTTTTTTTTTTMMMMMITTMTTTTTMMMMNFQKHFAKLLCVLTLSGHSDFEAFFQTTVLTTVPGKRGNFTFFVVRTFMVHPLGNTPSEKSLQHYRQTGVKIRTER
jgi:hypothetical protein